MYRISCFADEISPELNQQIAFMKTNGICYASLRSVSDKNVADLTDGELAAVKKQFSAAGIRFSSIGSPIGKVHIQDEFSAHLQKFRRVAAIADYLEAPYIRIFSFYMDKPEQAAFAETVISRLQAMVQIAEERQICLLHENEAGIFGESSANCQKLFAAVDSPWFGAVLDPSNFVAAGENPLDSYQKIASHVRYMHIKDSRRDTGEIVVAGQGDGQIRQLLDLLRDRDGLFLTLEPHLEAAGQFRGFTGPARFREGLDALRQMLDELAVSYG